MTVKELIEKLQSMPEEFKGFDVMVHVYARLRDTYSVEIRQDRYVGKDGNDEFDRFIVVHAG